MSILYNYFNSVVVKKLMVKFNYSSIMQVPRIEKIVLNMGVGTAISDKKILNNAVSDLSLISGQKPLITKVRKSVAGFKIRKGYPIGCKVTLRGKRKWDFFHRLIAIAIPRIRDFRGFPRSSFDGQGNYNFGIKEQIIFPEINYDKIDKIRGLNVTVATTSLSSAEGYELLSAFNFPFRN
ncbi:50S ribosomal protein L5 [Buchnera aphidicola (Anoecia corni)]|uniref:Large ribosomal subunit protein uL5 n=1 Tax=Buchnera aphidicola (Anoecia corni) TaxID=2994477 RepID=A0AAT9IGL5_9GAMM